MGNHLSWVVVMGDMIYIYILTNKNDAITGKSWDKSGTPNHKPTIFGGVFFATHKHGDFGDGLLLVLPHECSFVWF